MGFNTAEVLTRIHYSDDKTERFLSEWFDNGCDYIKAHTSGSTGSPKEIRLAKRDMVISARLTNRFFSVDGKSTLVCPLSSDYIAGKMMIVRAIVSNAHLYMEAPSNNPVIRDYGTIDLLPVVPSQIDSIIESKQKRRQIKSLLVGGAKISEGLEAKIIDSGINAYCSYGMTETCSHVALRKIKPGNDIYTALGNNSFTTDNRGCLVIINRDFSFGELTTNDVVKLIDAKNFKWIGRIDNAINSGGIKVFPEMIESKIRRFIPSGKAYYITSSPDKKWGETPLLVIEGTPFDTTAIEIQIRDALDPAERPSKICFIKAFDKTSTGKVKRIKPNV